MKIRQTNLHFADNTEIDGSDKFHKMRDICDNLNLSSHGASKLSKYLYVDESRPILREHQQQAVHTGEANPVEIKDLGAGNFEWHGLGISAIVLQGNQS